MFFFLTILSDINYFDDPIIGTECQVLICFSYFGDLEFSECTYHSQSLRCTLDVPWYPFKFKNIIWPIVTFL